MHKSGFVNIVGSPNVGKSTLMNAMVGERLSIITSKSQTTRHRILGIVSGDDYQIVYSDTPGILRPNYRLQQTMMRQVQGAVQDADVILYVTDTVEQAACDGVAERGAETLRQIKESGIPTIVVINKIDLASQAIVQELADRWSSILPDASVAAVSALNGFGTDALLGKILSLLPEGEPYFPKDTLTDRSLRFFASEIIREKILLNYDKEIPYCVEIVVQQYEEKPEIDRIEATVYVSRPSQKGIIIGRGGQMLKRVGTQARKDLERFLGKKVFLQLQVKVSDDWRNDAASLRRFGYEE